MTHASPQTNVPAVWIKRAQCLRHLGDMEGAIDCYEAVVQNEPEDVDSRLALAEIYERVNDRERALELVNEVLRQRDQPQAAMSDESGSQYSDNGASEAESGNEPAAMSESGTRRSGKRRKRSKREGQGPKKSSAALTREEKLEEDRRIQTAFDANMLKLQELDRVIDQNKSETGEVDSSLLFEWLEVVSYLIDSYRTTRALFPSDGKKKFAGLFKPLKKRNQGRDVEQEANVMASRLQATLEEDDPQQMEPDANVEQDSYRGVSFDEWAKLAVRVRSTAVSFARSGLSFYTVRFHADVRR